MLVVAGACVRACVFSRRCLVLRGIGTPTLTDYASVSSPPVSYHPPTIPYNRQRPVHRLPLVQRQPLLAAHLALGQRHCHPRGLGPRDRRKPVWRDVRAGRRFVGGAPLRRYVGLDRVGRLAWITSAAAHPPSHPPLLPTAAGVLVTVGWGRVSVNLNLVRINGGQFSCGYMRAFGQTYTWAVVVYSIDDGDSMMSRAECITHTFLHNTQDRRIHPDRPDPGSWLGAGWNLR